ncbi:MAG: hypothetical protein HUU35_18860, partial [Armatimonadetes bacterium]|nr:hypothetical protein [Armatimonadota bacterium]
MRLLGLVSLYLLLLPAAAQEGPNLIKNGSFEEPFAADGKPAGWAVYGGLTPTRVLRAATLARTGKQALQLEDQDPGEEIGITQTVAAEPNKVYRASVWIHAFERFSSAGSHLQMRFLPSNQYRQVSLVTRAAAGWRQVRVTGLAPADTKQVTLYLYSHRDPIPRLLLDDVELVAGA